VTGEAYLFKGSECYRQLLQANPDRVRPQTDGFKCFHNSLFARDIGAAHAYMFKDNNYILFHFTPGETNHYIIGVPKEIVPRNWPALKGVLPRKNRALDVYEFTQQNLVRDQDD
jgi:hypothetical protein